MQAKISKQAVKCFQKLESGSDSNRFFQADIPMLFFDIILSKAKQELSYDEARSLGWSGPKVEQQKSLRANSLVNTRFYSLRVEYLSSKSTDEDSVIEELRSAFKVNMTWLSPQLSDIHELWEPI